MILETTSEFFFEIRAWSSKEARPLNHTAHNNNLQPTMSNLVRQNAVTGFEVHDESVDANTVPEHDDAMLDIVLPLQECEGRSESTVELRRKQLKAMCDWYASNHDDMVAIKEVFSAHTVKEFCEGTGRAGSVPDYCKACAFTLEKLGGADDEVAALNSLEARATAQAEADKADIQPPKAEVFANAAGTCINILASGQRVSGRLRTSY